MRVKQSDVVWTGLNWFGPLWTGSWISILRTLKSLLEGVLGIFGMARDVLKWLAIGNVQGGFPTSYRSLSSISRFRDFFDLEILRQHGRWAGVSRKNYPKLFSFEI